jgi:hypothetical protein
VKPDRPAGGVEVKLAALRRKLPELWDSAAAALANGQDQLAGLALRRRRVLMCELESLSQLLDAEAPQARVVPRIEAADRLLEASLFEASRTDQALPKEPVMLELDPAVQSDLRRLREDVRNQPRGGPVTEQQEGGA